MKRPGSADSLSSATSAMASGQAIRLLARFAAALLLACPVIVPAMPYTPKSPGDIIEKLPLHRSADNQELRRMRKALTARPDNPALASGLARRYIEIGRRSGDPRYFGYAQAALRPWWTAAAPPAEIRVLRATLLQSEHRFADALADLDAIVLQNPYDAQAWLTRATILQVQGRFGEARSSCARLAGIAPELVTLTCAANAASLSGPPQASYTQLKNGLATHVDMPADLKIWSLTVLAEMAARIGNQAAAEEHFQQAMALGEPDSYLLGAYADLLLDQHRHADAASLLKDHTQVDGLLLRYAQALQHQQSPGASRYIDMLRARFHAARLRGDTVHRREQARFELHMQKNPSAALQLARQNWDVQKEPADARILLESAIATRDQAAIRVVENWIEESGLRDKTLQALLEQAEALP